MSFANAEETLWNSQDVEMENVTANGKYFAMNTENVTIYDSHGKTKPEMTKIIITDEKRKDTE